MTYMRIDQAVIEVPNHRGLLEAARIYRGAALTLISRFRVRKPLTQAQARRLPKAIRERLG